MRSIVLSAALLLAACGPKPATIEDLYTRPVTLTGGQVIEVETMVDTRDLLRGLMFRTSLAPDRGMLFVHQKPGNYSTWMYQHKIPLDILWMDEKHRIVEIVENAPPCPTVASQCPHYGGAKTSQFMLELAAGGVKRYHLAAGQLVQW